MDLKENFIKAEHTETGEIVTLEETATFIKDAEETETIKIYEDTKDETFNLFDFSQGTALKLVEERGFYTGVFVNHFKNKHYFILGIACIKEEDYMVYRAEYGEGKVYIRPLDMFLSEVDKKKYPDAEQKYRFELIGDITKYLDFKGVFAQYEEPTIVKTEITENQLQMVECIELGNYYELAPLKSEDLEINELSSLKINMYTNSENILPITGMHSSAIDILKEIDTYVKVGDKVVDDDCEMYEVLGGAYIVDFHSAVAGIVIHNEKLNLTKMYCQPINIRYLLAPYILKNEEKVLVYKNSDGDTRTAEKVATFTNFSIANDMHKQDVRNIMNEIAFDIMQNGRKHDFTKKDYELDFYNDYKSTIEKGTNFVEGEWYKLHCEKEKHHEEGYELHKDELTLLDIIEMMVDKISSAAARSGEIKCYDIKLSQEEIMKCFDNTIEYIKDKIKIADK